jgi:hypothetical protein
MYIYIYINIHKYVYRWHDICLSTQQELSTTPHRRDLNQGLSTDEVDILIKNCSCQLGDVIDDRHMSWIEMSTSQTGIYIHV